MLDYGRRRGLRPVRVSNKAGWGMEENQANIDLTCYLKRVRSLRYGYLNDITRSFYGFGKETHKYIKLLRWLYKRVIKPQKRLSNEKLYFDTERLFEKSMNVVFKMMNTAVPGRPGIYFKNIAFDAIDDYEERITLKKPRPGNYKKLLILEKFYELKAVYTIYEVKRFMRCVEIDKLNPVEALEIGMVYGGALQVRDYIQRFSIEKNCLEYYKIGQSIIKKTSSYKYDPEYRYALRIALIKIREGDPADHSELAKFIIGLKAFAHLKLKQLRETILPFAMRRGKVRGVKKNNQREI